MIRKLLVLALLGAALAAASMFPLRKSDAARSLQPSRGNERVQSLGRALPNFDIRLAEKGEFLDYDLTSPAGKQSATQNAATRARVSAVDQFRASSKSDVENLRAVVNEAGALKNIFIDGGRSLSRSPIPPTISPEIS